MHFETRAFEYRKLKFGMVANTVYTIIPKDYILSSPSGPTTVGISPPVVCASEDRNTEVWQGVPYITITSDVTFLS